MFQTSASTGRVNGLKFMAVIPSEQCELHSSPIKPPVSLFPHTGLYCATTQLRKLGKNYLLDRRIACEQDVGIRSGRDFAK